MQGLIAALESSGALTLYFLGTDPSLPELNAPLRELDHPVRTRTRVLCARSAYMSRVILWGDLQTLNAEMLELQRIIRAAGAGSMYTIFCLLLGCEMPSAEEWGARPVAGRPPCWCGSPSRWRLPALHATDDKMDLLVTSATPHREVSSKQSGQQQGGRRGASLPMGSDASLCSSPPQQTPTSLSAPQ